MNKRVIVLAGILFLLMARMIPSSKAQEALAPVKSKAVIGLAGVKNNAKGSLKVDGRNLVFTHAKSHADISAFSISDTITGADNERAVGGTVGMMTMVAPYGSGRFLSLFRKKIDTLSIQYHDSDGSLHGVIFTMPIGVAENIKKDLVAQGAKTSIAGRKPLECLRHNLQPR